MSMEEANNGFTQGVRLATEAAVKGGAALEHMIVTLDNQKFRLQLALVQIQDAKTLKEKSGGIIAPNGFPKPPYLGPGRG